MAAPANPNPVFQMDPYDGDINPATAEGAKLFTKATAARTNLLTLSQDKAKEVVSAFEEDAREFGWGAMVHKVQIVLDNNNALKKSILKDYRQVKLDRVKKEAERRWGTENLPFEDPVPTPMIIRNIEPSTTAADRPVFYARIKATMIATRILKVLRKLRRRH